MSWKRNRAWPDNSGSGRTDSIYDSEPDLSYLNEDGVSETFQPRQMLEQLIFSDAWFPGRESTEPRGLRCVQWSPHEACILTLFIVLQKRSEATRSSRFSSGTLLQELIFIDGGAPAELAHEVRVAGSTSRCCVRTSSPALFRILERIWEPGTMWKGCRDAATGNTLVNDDHSSLDP